ncbi:membrane protein [Candidatus Magnetobacterium bavaricum]|uniref:Membrane protein n=1 Tax=Candidatus Magnetobacterium bavaricum TaxID=29290 RepID=A0A0F3GSU3_9BACT|nr:membrane protein [Candidatus Magnetobacterium bavaricum]
MVKNRFDRYIMLSIRGLCTSNFLTLPWKVLLKPLSFNDSLFMLNHPRHRKGEGEPVINYNFNTFAFKLILGTVIWNIVVYFVLSIIYRHDTFDKDNFINDAIQVLRSYLIIEPTHKLLKPLLYAALSIKIPISIL